MGSVSSGLEPVEISKPVSGYGGTDYMQLDKLLNVNAEDIRSRFYVAISAMLCEPSGLSCTSLLGIRRPGREADHSLPSKTLKTHTALALHFRTYSLSVVCQRQRIRGNQ